MNLYVGKTAVKSNIPEAEAVDGPSGRYRVKSLIVGFVLGLCRQDAAKAVNDIAIIAIDDIPI